MQGFVPARSVPQGVRWGALVLALHLVVVWLLMGPLRPAKTGPLAEVTVQWLRLLREPTLDAVAPPPTAPDAARSPRAAPVQRSNPPATAAAANEPRSEAITVEPLREPPAPASAPLAAASVPSLPASAALNLRYSPGLAWRSATPAAAAHNDPQRQPDLNRDERLARDLGTDTRLIETVTAQGRRYSSGLGCVELRPARATGLDPFNHSVRPSPQLAGKC